MKTNLYNILIKRTEDGDKTEYNVIAKSKEDAIDFATKYYIENDYDFEILDIDETVLNFNKEVTSVYGDTKLIDESMKKIYDYNNSKRTITYNVITAPSSNEPCIPYYCEYTEDGIINDIEDRLNTWNNPVKLTYALMIDFNAAKNDPNKKIWDTCVEYVKNHESEFFTKNGDWKQRIQAAKNKMELEIVKNI